MAHNVERNNKKALNNVMLISMMYRYLRKSCLLYHLGPYTIRDPSYLTTIVLVSIWCQEDINPNSDLDMQDSLSL